MNNDLKYYIENIVTIISEYVECLNNLSSDEKDEYFNLLSDGNIEGLYDFYKERNPSFVDKYNINKDSTLLGIIVTLQSGFSDLYINGISKDYYLDIIKNIIDIYEQDAVNMLDFNNIFVLNDYLSFYNDEKYKNVLKKIIYKFFNKKDYSDKIQLLNNIDSKLLDKDIILKFLNSINLRDVDNLDVLYTLIKKVELDKEIIDLFLTKIQLKYDNFNFLEGIPIEYLDEKNSIQLLTNSFDLRYDNVLGFLNMLPNDVLTKEVCETALNMYRRLIIELPERSPFKSVTQAEYEKWYSDKLKKYIGPSFHDSEIIKMFRQIKPCFLTEEVLEHFITNIEEPEILKEIINKSIEYDKMTRRLMEFAINKNLICINSLPIENFDKSITQDEYNHWVEKIIVNAIENNDIEVMLDIVPNIRKNEVVWNLLLDKVLEKEKNNPMLDLSSKKINHLSLECVSYNNMTPSMIKRACDELSIGMFMFAPAIDTDIGTLSPEKAKEHVEWLSKMSDDDKKEYRKFYEELFEYCIKKENNLPQIGAIPKGAITLKMYKNIVDYKRTTYDCHDCFIFPNEVDPGYIDLIIYMLEKQKTYADPPVDIFKYLTNMPEQYMTDEVIRCAIKVSPLYMKYVDPNKENYGDYLNIAYKDILVQKGRNKLTQEEIILIKKFFENNYDLFDVLNLDILEPKIVNIIGENSLEKIVRYKDFQNMVINMFSNEEVLKVFSFVLNELSMDSIFVEPLIEVISSNAIGCMYKGDFLKIVCKKLDSGDNLNDYERTVISYLVMNPEEIININEYNDILDYVNNKNDKLNRIVFDNNSSLVDIKNAYLERVLGITYYEANDLVVKFGNDIDELLAKYNKDTEDLKEKTEIEAIEILIKIKTFLKEMDPVKIKRAYREIISLDDSVELSRFKNGITLENILKRAYGRDMVENLESEKKSDLIENDFNGQVYYYRKLDSSFKRMVSLMGAYRKNNDVEGDMYERWNTNQLASTHALCYSYINNSHTGTAMLGNKDGIIISINGFVPESIVASAPYDLNSDARKNTVTTKRQQRFYLAKNMLDQTRGRYSEYVIEIQDVREGITKYQKIQPASIICFEEIDEDSIKASIELSKKLGRIVPIELIDRLELAKTVTNEIESLFQNFISNDTLNTELIRDIITKFNNVRNAHMHSGLASELVGESHPENLEAPFNKIKLNNLLLECLSFIEKQMVNGNVELGLRALDEIEKIIMQEMEKNPNAPSKYQKFLLTGIEEKVFYKIDELKRKFKKEKYPTKPIKIFEMLDDILSNEGKTFEILKDMYRFLPEQVIVRNFFENIDLKRIETLVKEIQEKGFYKDNLKYSEEHIARVLMFCQYIAKNEKLDDKTMHLLEEVARYYSCGRKLDMSDIAENHGEYSAGIAGYELKEKYSESDIRIIQASIELQAFKTEVIDLKENFIKELIVKYNLTEDEIETVKLIACYVSDSVELDNTRFIKKANGNNPLGEEFNDQMLVTDSAKKLVKVSYDIQEQLAKDYLMYISNVINIDFNKKRDEIMDSFFTERSQIFNTRILPENVVESSIVQLQFFMHENSKYSYLSENLYRDDYLKQLMYRKKLGQLGIKENDIETLSDLFGKQDLLENLSLDEIKQLKV